MPVVGRAGRPDIAHPRLSIEVKTRRRLPAWLVSALGQAVRAARDGQVAIVVLHRTGQHHENDLAILRLGDLERLLGEKTHEPDDLRPSAG